MPVWRKVLGIEANAKVGAIYAGAQGLNREVQTVYCGDNGVNRLVHGSVPSSGRVYFYREGDECVANTGGWTATVQIGMTIAKNNDSLCFLASDSSMIKRCSISTNNMVDVSRYGKLGIRYLSTITRKSNNNNSYFACYYANRNNVMPGSDTGGTRFEWDNFYSPKEEGEICVDISPASGSYYVVLCHYSDGAQTGEAIIKEVWFEE